MIQNLLHKFTIHFQKLRKYKPNYAKGSAFCISSPFTFTREKKITQINDSESVAYVYQSLSKVKKIQAKLIFQNLLHDFNIHFQN